ncbi:unannotated protein [freshwater metagenome]|uniref:Unannotated protein n=1 Tax=freshwater metagenome TaxID=449393 RepID=A0A6J6Y4V6_9ZZZZ
MSHVAAQEDLARFLAKLDGTQTLGHAVLRHHRPSNSGGFLNVIGCPSSGVVENQFLGGTATEHVSQLIQHFVARCRILFLVGQHHRVTQGATARQDGHLVHWVGVLQCRGDQRVATFVIGSDRLLVIVHHARMLLRTGDNTVNGLVHGFFIHHRQVMACRQQGGLIQDVG